MSLPKLGMYYSDVSKRVNRIKKMPGIAENKTRLINSLINQAVRNEGEGARKELVNEMFENHSMGRSGYTPRYHSNWDKIFGSG